MWSLSVSDFVQFVKLVINDPCVRVFRPFIINYLFIIKMMTKNETWDMVIIWLFSQLLFHLFSFTSWKIKFLHSIFFFQLQFWFCYHWWQIMKQNGYYLWKSYNVGRWWWMNDEVWVSLHRGEWWAKLIILTCSIGKKGTNQVYQNNSFQPETSFFYTV